AAWLSMRGPARRQTSRIALEVVGVAAAIGLAIAWTHLDGQSSAPYRGGVLLCGVAATFVIAAIAHRQSGRLARVLSFGPLRALGLISYGVYLYHWPIDVVLDAQRVHLGGWPLFCVQTASTLVVATASFVIVEQPIRRGALTSLRL